MLKGRKSEEACRTGGKSTYVLDDHDKERQFDAQCLFGIRWAGNVVGRYVCACNFNDRRLNIRICDALDMTIPHLLIPNLEWFAADRVQDGQKSYVKTRRRESANVLDKNATSSRMTIGRKGQPTDR